MFSALRISQTWMDMPLEQREKKKEKVVDMVAIVVIKEPILTKLSKSDFCLRL